MHPDNLLLLMPQFNVTLVHPNKNLLNYMGKGLRTDGPQLHHKIVASVLWFKLSNI